MVITAPISTTNITGLRICTRGSSLRSDSTSAGRMISGSNSERGWFVGHAAVLLVESEVELEHVHAGLAEQAEEAAVGVVGDQAVDLGERQVADRGDPVRLDPGVGLGDVGIDARGRRGDRVDRHVGGGQARVVAAARAPGRSARLRLDLSARVRLLGPRLLKKVTSAL